MMSRALVAVLAGVLALTPGLDRWVAPAGLAAATPHGAAADVENERDSTADASSSTSNRPEGSAWIIGAVAFVASLVLVVGGRWWVRNRVGRLQQ